MEKKINVKKVINEGSLEEIMIMLNAFLDQILAKEEDKDAKIERLVVLPNNQIDRTKEPKYQKNFTTIDSINALFSIVRQVDLSRSNYKFFTTIISKREMIEMVSEFFKSLGPEISSDYSRHMINLLDSMKSIELFNSDDNVEARKRHAAAVFYAGRKTELRMGMFSDLNPRDMDTINSILDPHVQYASIDDAIILAHELAHFMYRSKELTESQSNPKELNEVNSIFIESLIEDFISKKYPQYATEMDLHRFHRQKTEYERMKVRYGVSGLVLYRRNIGKKITFDDLKKFARPGSLDIHLSRDLTSATDNSRHKSPTDKKVTKTTDNRLDNLRDTLKVIYKVMSRRYYYGKKRVLTLEDESKTQFVVPNLLYRDGISYTYRSFIYANYGKKIL